MNLKINYVAGLYSTENCGNGHHFTISDNSYHFCMDGPKKVIVFLYLPVVSN